MSTPSNLPLLPRPKSLYPTSEWVDIGGGLITFAGFSADLLAATLPNELPWRMTSGCETPNVSAIKPGDRSWCEAPAPDPVELPSGPDEAYQLMIEKPSVNRPPIIVQAKTLAGERQALRTLSQLIKIFGRRLPTLKIDDRPDFSQRGVMLDISRARVPQMSDLFSIIDLLASLKVNHLQLYTEHTFAYEGHETVWNGCDPLTAEEVRRLDEYCLRRGIVLAANQNCFGHMERWLNHKEYRHLAEISGEWNFFGHPRAGPFSLCPTDEGSLILIENLLSQLLPNFTARMVNIGCDETADVGQGRSRAAVERDGFAAVYWKYISSVVNWVESKGFYAQIWADMLLKMADEDIPELSSNLTCLIWGYEPDEPFGEWCRRLTGRGVNVWVCPGTSSWRSITGRTFERRANISKAACEGLQNGATGLMVTDWGDLGHRQQFPISLIGLANGAAAGWNAEAEFNAQDFAAVALACPTGSAGEWLERLGDADLPLRRSGWRTPTGSAGVLRNASALFTDLHTPLNVITDEHPIESWFEVMERLGELGRNLPEGVLDGQVAAELRHTVEVAHFAAARAVARRNKHRASGLYRRLAGRMNDLIREHIRLWNLRSRPGGLKESVGFYEAVASELETTDE